MLQIRREARPLTSALVAPKPVIVADLQGPQAPRVPIIAVVIAIISHARAITGATPNANVEASACVVRFRTTTPTRHHTGAVSGVYATVTVGPQGGLKHAPIQTAASILRRRLAATLVIVPVRTDQAPTSEARQTRVGL